MAPPPLHSLSDAADLAATTAALSLSAAEFSTLHRLAVAAKAAAYCPYSRFRVGAAVLGADGSFTTGANVENAAYPVGTCAERCALGKAVTGGVDIPGPGRTVEETRAAPVRSFRAVAVATDISPPASPCGMCRQFIREFCDLKTPVIMFDNNSDYVHLTLEELLPISFGPEALPPPVPQQ